MMTGKRTKAQGPRAELHGPPRPVLDTTPRPEGRPIRGLRRLPAAPPAGDLATRVRDCPFQAECDTYGDALVPAALKGPAGRGCVDQTDEHRKQHCKAFARKLLARILRDVMTSSEPL